MNNLFLAGAIKPKSRQLITVMALMVIFGGCRKTEMVSPDNALPTAQKKAPPPPPPSPANPAIIFNADTTFQFRGQTRSVQGIFVMDADGSHRKMIFHDYLTSGSSWSIGTASDPRWSGNGQQICFSGRVFSGSIPAIRPQTAYTSIFTMNFSLVNGVPTASNVTKILDGAAAQVSYGSPVWSPVANEISLHSFGSDNIQKLQIIPSTGGTLTTLYTCQPGFAISSPCFSPDGSKIAFHLRSTQTSDKWIKIIDKTTGNELNSIPLDPSTSFSRLDWSRASGSTLLTFRSIIPNSGGQGSLFTLDFSVSSTPVPVASNAAYPTWSPDDSKIAYSESTSSQGVIKVLTLSTNTTTTISTAGGYSLNWKR